MKILNQDIKDRQFKPVYLLFGEEAFLKKSYKNRLKEAMVGDDTMNFHQFEGKGVDLKEIISLADTMPFFGERRLILIEDSGLFKGSGAEALVEYLPQMPDTTCLLFVESEVDKRSRMYKKVKELGYGADMVRQDARQLSSWAGGILAREGKKITGHTMELFLSKTGDDMENIRMELDKLISYTLGREVITDQDVEEICANRVTNKIFDMVAAIVSGKTRAAMDLYEDLLTLREPPMRILFLIARQFNQVLQVKELMAQGMDRSRIASSLKLQPFVVGKIMPQARSFTREQILSRVELCVDCEEAVKTGRLGERLAVELLITKQYKT
ncbi:MAG: DNA polymerase III subunit delta [Hungatella sp.]|jgi:DNA polymerase-3 subunit delta|nr:DNA polymerase III subunit delta [Hungatella sp.]MCI9503532.1 DNA polymerase III subunit delta [Hungatella sp.]MCI9635750.1 DNA polymerase III subunit delta [Hungatella sp.]